MDGSTAAACLEVGCASTVVCTRNFTDEALPPEAREKYRFLNILPDWRWESYAIVVLVIVIFVTLEGAYRAVSRKECEVAQVLDEYAYTLTLDNLHVDHDSTIPHSSLQISLMLRSSINRALKFHVEVFDISLDGYTLAQPIFLNRSGILAPLATTQFRYPPFPHDMLGERTQFNVRIEVIILYGHPDFPPTRRWARTIKQQLQLAPRMAGPFLYEREEESPV